MVQHSFFQFLVIHIIVYAKVESKTFREDYYWRDYKGTIPEDAFKAGQARNGRPTYIGQVLFENKLIPGQIYEGDGTIYFEFGLQQRTATTNVKILCTQEPERFEWIPTNQNKVVLLTNKLLIRGGYEVNYFTYIARVNEGGATSIGKLMCSEINCLGLFMAKDGKSQRRDTFELLAVKPSVSTADSRICNPAIDVRLNDGISSY